MGACAGTFEVERSFVSRFIIEALRASSTYERDASALYGPKYIVIIIRYVSVTSYVDCKS